MAGPRQGRVWVARALELGQPEHKESRAGWQGMGASAAKAPRAWQDKGMEDPGQGGVCQGTRARAMPWRIQDRVARSREPGQLGH